MFPGGKRTNNGAMIGSKQCFAPVAKWFSSVGYHGSKIMNKFRNKVELFRNFSNGLKIMIKTPYVYDIHVQ